MKIFKGIMSLALIFTTIMSFTACGKKNETQKAVERTKEDTRVLSDNEYTVNSISATDKYGRAYGPSDGRIDDKYVGIFYFLWLGQHQGAGQNGIYNVTELLENDPDSLWDISVTNKVSPLNTYHYWGEPLYGYYNSDDEWVIRKHIEEFTMAGIDFMCFDTTNAYSYSSVALKVISLLNEYASDGWKVPKVMFYTNSSPVDTVRRIYNDIYVAHPEYSELWFAPGGKPMIVTVVNDFIDRYDDDFNPVYKEEYKDIVDFFEFKDSQWPNESNTKKQNGFPWIEWTYPQYNHGGVMNVSVAQHNTVRMSNRSEGNCGRGYDFTLGKNVEEKADEGLNYEYQWKTVLDNKDDVNITFVTGWNEWIALKLSDGAKAFFVDTFNKNYSRDIEFDANGYGDNFYLQTARNIRKYKFKDAEHYKYVTKSPTGIDDAVWNEVRTYKDFVNDCKERNSNGFYKNKYVDKTGRNDISDIKVTHDAEYLYIRVTCADNVTEYTRGDDKWMNVFLGTGLKGYSYGDYQFILNRNPNGGKTTLERFTAYNKTSVVSDDIDFIKSGRNIMFKVPLYKIGLNENACAVKFKVTDNVTLSEDFLTFYKEGDSAPIGRLSYTYGY